MEDDSSDSGSYACRECVGLGHGYILQSNRIRGVQPVTRVDGTNSKEQSWQRMQSLPRISIRLWNPTIWYSWIFGRPGAVRAAHSVRRSKRRAKRIPTLFRQGRYRPESGSRFRGQGAGCADVMVIKNQQIVFQQAGALRASDLDDLIAQAKAWMSTRPLPKRLRRKRSRLKVTTISKVSFDGKHQRHFLFCPPVAYACFAHLLHMRPPGFHGVR